MFLLFQKVEYILQLCVHFYKSTCTLGHLQLMAQHNDELVRIEGVYLQPPKLDSPACLCVITQDGSGLDGTSNDTTSIPVE